MNKIRVALLVFLLISIADIVGIIFKLPTIIFVFKPLIILSLIVLYVLSVTKRNAWYILALFFSFLGDVFLLFTGELFFIAGLVSFLITHLLFIKIVISQVKKYSWLKVLFSIIPFLLVFSFLIYNLKEGLHEMLLPVIIYGLTISTFGAISFIDFLNTRSKKSLLMFSGAVVFMLSDCVLAIDTYYLEDHINKILIMFSYILAQYLIYRSVILNSKKNKQL
ncbi:MAG: hypothetical protein GQ540_05255 [Lutibacter sp.]|uniref:lysoplasmalogenase n=1 Tax=Lutibacter sp. TaxID=1925666 RepID=UPI0019FC46EB|nr:lysoplasmalogenase [Lutibacter sp.]NOR27916.1 hypothetical protein [Lutibacter sp.]